MIASLGMWWKQQILHYHQRRTSENPINISQILKGQQSILTQIMELEFLIWPIINRTIKSTDKTVRMLGLKPEMRLNREERMLMPRKEIISNWLQSMRSPRLFSRSATLKMRIIDLFNRLREALRLLNKKLLRRQRWRDLTK